MHSAVRALRLEGVFSSDTTAHQILGRCKSPLVGGYFQLIRQFFVCESDVRTLQLEGSCLLSGSIINFSNIVLQLYSPLALGALVALRIVKDKLFVGTLFAGK